MVAALHSLNLMVTLVDMAAADQPLVWLSGGFERVTGFKPAQVVEALRMAAFKARQQPRD